MPKLEAFTMCATKPAEFTEKTKFSHNVKP